MTGGNPHYIGIPMRECHRKLKITDEQFDRFVGYAVQALKEMKVKMDCLKEAVVAIN